jgi:hypothetical protein
MSSIFSVEWNVEAQEAALLDWDLFQQQQKQQQIIRSSNSLTGSSHYVPNDVRTVYVSSIVHEHV